MFLVGFGMPFLEFSLGHYSLTMLISFCAAQLNVSLMGHLNSRRIIPETDRHCFLNEKNGSTIDLGFLVFYFLFLKMSLFCYLDYILG